MDTDGPDNITFSIPEQYKTTSELVTLENYRSVEKYTKMIDIVLIKPLDRDFVRYFSVNITCTSGRCNRQSEFTLLHFAIFL